ncbi:SMP-30/gluconolactonase/LRE family protein [Virgisporangium aurantiacum]|uniref:Gluconolaconase n=1 Tax=Virgisporangium aurantiacum TaxID=175570 RepID=A0A8J3ZGK3_9ACTN|nr:SMP-30/gluconolactonase/LRE family protein [Virgisporangium aurantiacum]GIJ63737.1 gluconolaconase [Virgisporangium aurantiacum]
MIDVLSDIVCDLGESALWDAERSRFYWVDITGCRIHALDWDTRRTSTLDVPEPVGCVALRTGGGLVAALRHELVFCDVDSGRIEVVRDVEAGRPGNRFNDGAVDPGGRFWFGSMDLAEAEPTGSFYCLSADSTVSRAFDGIICSNGPAWSLDGSTMYHVDSTRRRITAYEFDVDTGTVGAGRLFVSDEDELWFPDGVTVDAEGFIWNCKWDGGRIVRYSPDGAVDRVVELPVSRPTRCAFVGPDLNLLAVTTARIGMTDAALVAAPRSGQVLLVDPSTKGTEPTRFAG